MNFVAINNTIIRKVKNNMGSGASKSQLKCPKDYEPEKFKKILKLFDRLDSNGDQVVGTEELSKIADLHVRNKIRKYKNYIEKVHKETTERIKELDSEVTIKINKTPNWIT